MSRSNEWFFSKLEAATFFFDSINFAKNGNVAKIKNTSAMVLAASVTQQLFLYPLHLYDLLPLITNFCFFIAQIFETFPCLD